MTNLTTLICAAALAFSATASATPIISGFQQTIMEEADDGSFYVNKFGGMALNLNGKTHKEFWVNSNGNISFDGNLTSYYQEAFSTNNIDRRSFLAPFFADVDTRRLYPKYEAVGSHGTVGFGITEFDGHNAFAVTWDKVGYFPHMNDKKNTFQLVLVERADTGVGNFDFYYNYGALQWDKSSASSVARAGYSMYGLASDFEFNGSGVAGKLLNSGANALIKGSNVGVDGRYGFSVRQGVISQGIEKAAEQDEQVPLPGTLALLGIGAFALGISRRRKA